MPGPLARLQDLQLHTELSPLQLLTVSLSYHPCSCSLSYHPCSPSLSYHPCSFSLSYHPCRWSRDLVSKIPDPTVSPIVGIDSACISRLFAAPPPPILRSKTVRTVFLHAGRRGLACTLGRQRPASDGRASAGDRRARSHCRFAPPLIRFTPESLACSVPLFLKRQCGQTPGDRPERVRRARAEAAPRLAAWQSARRGETAVGCRSQELLVADRAAKSGGLPGPLGLAIA